MSDNTCKTEHCDSPVAPEHEYCLVCGMKLQIAAQAVRINETEARRCGACKHWRPSCNAYDDQHCALLSHWPADMAQIGYTVGEDGVFVARENFGCVLFEKKVEEKDLIDTAEQ